MRAHVLPDARLARLAGRFVRLDVNTEEPRNAAFLERFPIDAWPTLLVAITGYAQPEDVKRAVESGFDRHLAKPASAEDIVRLLA